MRSTNFRRALVVAALAVALAVPGFQALSAKRVNGVEPAPSLSITNF